MITSHDWDGIYLVSFDNSTLSATTISNNTITVNDRDGIWLESWDNSTLSPAISGNIITGNLTDGIYLVGGSTIDPVIDIGGGALGSTGLNSINNNANDDVANDTLVGIMAKYNWWGQAPPDSDKFFGPVDYSEWLTSSP
jgi:hypothetical protein